MARSFVIEDGIYGGRVMRVTAYNPKADGVEIRIEHDITKPRTRQLRWTQTVSENGSFFKACGLSTYVDPWAPNIDPSGKTVCKADDAKPFYWTDAEFNNTDGPYFYDKPSEGPPATGKTWIRFVTSLTEARTRMILVLASIVWGFDRAASGAVTVLEPRRATVSERSGHMRVLKRMYPAYDYGYYAPEEIPNPNGTMIA